MSLAPLDNELQVIHAAAAIVNGLMYEQVAPGARHHGSILLAAMYDADLVGESDGLSVPVLEALKRILPDGLPHQYAAIERTLRRHGMLVDNATLVPNDHVFLVRDAAQVIRAVSEEISQRNAEDADAALIEAVGDVLDRLEINGDDPEEIRLLLAQVLSITRDPAVLRQVAEALNRYLEL